MKKLVALVLAGITAAAGACMLSGCKKDIIATDDGMITIGFTYYAPMDYLEDGKLVGFDAELSAKVFENLGYEYEFKEIDWNTKVITLNSGEIDAIWNGMTVTKELKENICLSNSYLKNKQYGVVKAGEEKNYTSTASLENKKVAVEGGSAAADLIEGLPCTANEMETQNAAVMEVAAGTSDIAIVDYTMAMTLTAEGSDYYGKLAAVDVGFETEEYAVGFRKSDRQLCDKVNEQLKALKDNGYIDSLAKKYSVSLI